MLAFSTFFDAMYGVVLLAFARSPYQLGGMSNFISRYVSPCLQKFYQLRINTRHLADFRILLGGFSKILGRVCRSSFIVRRE